MNSKPFFKPEDFSPDDYMQYQGKEVTFIALAAHKANQLLEAALAAAPRVYIQGDWNTRVFLKEPLNYTHTAVIFGIEPIAKEPCKHVAPKDYCSTDRIFCLHCGIELVPEWKAKGEL